MQRHRKGESDNIPYRTGRFFVVDSKWFFTTREGIEHGPFLTKEKAESECLIYTRVCIQVENRFDQVGLPR